MTMNHDPQGALLIPVADFLETESKVSAGSSLPRVAVRDDENRRPGDQRSRPLTLANIQEGEKAAPADFCLQ